jgi:hypothetical protein
MTTTLLAMGTSWRLAGKLPDSRVPNMYAIRVGVALLLATSAARAQGLVQGTVVDDATGRPLAGALVRIAVGTANRQTRTDEAGAFKIPNVGLGRLTFSVRILGFEPLVQALDVVENAPPQAVRLKRLAMLDTVRVRAAKQGLFGVVATASDLRPLPNATLRIMSVGGGPIPLDSNGRFFVPIKTVGSYFLRAKAPGYEDQTMSVIVSPNDGVEVAFLLDTALKGPNHRFEIAMMAFDDRLKIRGLASALVPRSEIMKDPNANLAFALSASPSFVAKSLRWDFEACVYLDGYPRPGLSLNAIDPQEVEAVEVYNNDASLRPSDRTRSLLQGWPRSGVCGVTGMPSPARAHGKPPDDIIKWVVIWLKH